MSLDTLLDEIPAGWLVNQLHQLDDTSWRCNFRSAEGEMYTPTAFGSSASEALDEALNLIPSATHISNPTPTSFSIDPTPTSLDLSSILYPNLNLRLKL